MNIKEVLSFFDYNHRTGEIKWKVNRQGHVKAGDVAGTIFTNYSGKSYRSLHVKRKHYLAHRLCWLIYYGENPKGCIDHINGDGLDNRIKNLRDVTRSKNQRNMRVSSRSKTGVMGVSWCKRSSKWCARIKDKNKKTVHIGYFSDFFAAVCARKSLEGKYGYHDNHGQTRPL